ncbi:MAG: aminodeoxychorismate/anthranilate synthase component II [Planctomycetota bacterium]
MILLIDNYDSFVYNLARYFVRLGQETLVLRNDAVDADHARQLAPRAIVLSPGPGAPSQAGHSVDIVRRLHRETPMLGVCLGHQAIVSAFGGQVTRYKRPMHGRTSPIFHKSTDLFVNLPSPMNVCRYHSLVADQDLLPSDLTCTAVTDEGVVMAVRHETLAVYGVQFHPEALLTEHGYALLANFLRAIGCDVGEDAALLAASEDRTPRRITTERPHQPVTF